MHRTGSFGAACLARGGWCSQPRSYIETWPPLLESKWLSVPAAVPFASEEPGRLGRPGPSTGVCRIRGHFACPESSPWLPGPNPGPRRGRRPRCLRAGCDLERKAYAGELLRGLPQAARNTGVLGRGRAADKLGRAALLHEAARPGKAITGNVGHGGVKGRERTAVLILGEQAVP